LRRGGISAVHFLTQSLVDILVTGGFFQAAAFFYQLPAPDNIPCLGE
jgi:hypothetical protein